MIKLKKLAEPEILVNHAAAWTKTLIEKIASGTPATDGEKSRYRHADIKKVLVKETNGKCAYCESKLLHVTYGDVEHIVPKSTKVDVTFEWSNLTLACDVCNTNKSDKFSHGVGFVDPYVDDPVDHFNFVGGLVLAKPGDHDARLTEETLKLNRTELVERRNQRIRYLREQVEVIRHAPANLQQVLIASLQQELDDDKEYAAIARACLPCLMA
ncbi:HNH endonuclease [Massilia phyllosphaerae]|uniref:HNH endonuclease n=1 Tax=Massilia phyllosphaerae TaxID=3106034 RepID=UPI002B1CB793|nr:HNH endonuclease [Massilia sp. SGZ-792]